MKPSGFLLVDKPRGVSTFNSLRTLKKYFKPQKIGFAGTLDPDATGLLIVGVGKATRLLKYMESLSKTYTVKVLPGKISDTYDDTGDIETINSKPGLNKEEVLTSLQQFIGEISQVPPKYSAIKINGKRACDRVRKGEEVEMKARNVTVYSIQLVSWGSIEFTLEVNCSKGTYIRSLVHDLGQALGCGAVASQIRRTGIGKYHVENAISIEEDKFENYFIPLKEAVEELPVLKLDPMAEEDILHGNFISKGRYKEIPVANNEFKHGQGELAVVNHNGELVAIGEMNHKEEVCPKLVLKDILQNNQKAVKE